MESKKGQLEMEIGLIRKKKLNIKTFWLSFFYIHLECFYKSLLYLFSHITYIIEKHIF